MNQTVPYRHQVGKDAQAATRSVSESPDSRD
jgi:hypothetical protein